MLDLITCGRARGKVGWGFASSGLGPTGVNVYSSGGLKPTLRNERYQRCRVGFSPPPAGQHYRRMVSGVARPSGEGAGELRIHHGPGYRVYFVQRGPVLIVLLCGGDKSTQARDIEAAKQMARELT